MSRSNEIVVLEIKDFIFATGGTGILPARSHVHMANVITHNQKLLSDKMDQILSLLVKIEGRK